MLKKIYLAFGIGVILLYGAGGLFGWEVSTASRNTLPPDARSNGYRSFHFWHYGFHGGK